MRSAHCDKAYPDAMNEESIVASVDSDLDCVKSSREKDTLSYHFPM
jgi:hypothetical protein